MKTLIEHRTQLIINMIKYFKENKKIWRTTEPKDIEFVGNSTYRSYERPHLKEGEILLNIRELGGTLDDVSYFNKKHNVIASNANGMDKVYVAKPEAPVGYMFVKYGTCNVPEDTKEWLLLYESFNSALNMLEQMSSYKFTAKYKGSINGLIWHAIHAYGQEIR